MNKRLSLWCEYDNVISDAQFGFKKGHSTIDEILILQSIVQEYLHKGKKLYCTFVDIRKAFDSIYRNGLWFRLYICGIRGKMLKIMKSMYCNVKSCVKHLGNKSIFFDSLIGLKQGEVLSPLLFSLFVEDLEMFILNRDSCGLTLEEITIILLLFADDMVIIAETPEDMQKSLNSLHEYWSHEVNTEKLK